MKNYLLIILVQVFPTWAGIQVRKLQVRMQGRTAVAVPFLENIDHFKSARKKEKHVLVMMRPSAWMTALAQYPDIQLYNNSGFIYGLVKALNENGYIVDLLAENNPIQLTQQYDLFVGHGGSCKPLIDQLDPEIPIYQYISGLYWKVFDKESDERYTRFFDNHAGVKPDSHRRSITAMIEGLKFLNERADVMFTIYCPRMVAAYGKYSKKFYFTGLGAYLDDFFKIDPAAKNYDGGRGNFIYVGGTSGNLQKGLDLLIEAFATTPDLNLYIYCKVEEEILKYSKKELASPNINYIYNWRYKPFHKHLRQLLKNTNFSVHAPINIGMGTAFMATMGVGMIPVGYVDVPDPGESAVLTDSWQVDALRTCIREASEKSPEWCRNATQLTIAKYQEHCDPDVVQGNFREMFSLVK
jgi:glycosyltransferase involved in cell wall biosynthesis